MNNSKRKGIPIRRKSDVFTNKNIIAAQLRGEDVRSKAEWKPKTSSSKGK